MFSPILATVSAIASATVMAPTFAAWGGVQMPDVDGRDLAPVLERDPAPSWRKRLLIEHFAGHTWSGLRTSRYTYAEYAAGEKELYDMRKDPYELQNIAETADDVLLQDLHRRLESLRGCAKDGCRAADED